jgi:uncharacterized small protein (DUF1192 family)
MNTEKKDLDNLTVDELKEYIAILLDRIADLERSKEHYERISKSLSRK